jgi:serine/threonine protein kinase
VPRVCDFGLTRLLSQAGDSGLTTTSQFSGTARYLARELVGSEDPSPTMASDVHALGCIGFEVGLHQMLHFVKSHYNLVHLQHDTLFALLGYCEPLSHLFGNFQQYSASHATAKRTLRGIGDTMGRLQVVLESTPRVTPISLLDFSVLVGVYRASRERVGNGSVELFPFTHQLV